MQLKIPFSCRATRVLNLASPVSIPGCALLHNVPTSSIKGCFLKNAAFFAKKFKEI